MGREACQSRPALDSSTPYAKGLKLQGPERSAALARPTGNFFPVLDHRLGSSLSASEPSPQGLQIGARVEVVEDRSVRDLQGEERLGSAP